MQGQEQRQALRTQERESRVIVPLSEWPHPWPTVSGLRRFRDRSQADPRTRDGQIYGPFKPAFIKLGGRVLVDVEMFMDIVREQGRS